MDRISTTVGARRAAAEVVVLWPVLVTVGMPAFVLTFGPGASPVLALALVGGSTLLFARFGFLGLATTNCVRCGGAATVGQLYCPHCGELHERIRAPALQVITACVILPVWFLIAEGFVITLVGALSPLVGAVQPFVEYYRAFAFGGGFGVDDVLIASAVVPLVLTTLARVVLRAGSALAARRSDTPR